MVARATVVKGQVCWGQDIGTDTHVLGTLAPSTSTVKMKKTGLGLGLGAHLECQDPRFNPNALLRKQ